MDNIDIWTSVLLNSYCNLVNFADAVDVEVKRQSISSATCYCGVYEISNKIIDLIEKKVCICNTKILIEDIVNGLSSDLKKYFYLRFVDKVPIENIAEIKGVSNRSVYRKIDKLKERFSSALIKKGYTDDKLVEMYKDNLWLYKSYLNIKNIKTKKEASKLKLAVKIAVEN